MHRRTPSPFSAALALFVLLLFVTPGFLGAQATPPIPTNHVRIHYFCPDGNHLGWTVYAFGDTTEDTSNFNRGPVKVTGQDSFGAYFDLDITSAAQNVAIIIHKGNVKDPGPNDFLDPATQGIKYWQLSGRTYCIPLNRPRSSDPTHRFPQAKRAFTIIAPIMTTRSGTSSHFSLPTIRIVDFCGTNDFVTAYDKYGAYYDVGVDPTQFNGLLGFIITIAT